MTTLVTGGAGYIGSHTAVALHESGRDVVLLDNLANSSRTAVDAIRRLTADSLPFVEIDMLDEDALDRVFDEYSVTEVVHFAGLKAVGESVERPLDYYRNNLGSTLNLVGSMTAHGVDRIVFSSSATVYGEPRSVPVTEDSPTWATSPYGWTKHMVERILVDQARTGALRAVLLRYFNPVGAHHSGTIGEDPAGRPNNLVPFIMQVAIGRLDKLSVYGADYDTPDGTAVRDYIHVVDLADGHLAALDALADGGIECLPVNLGTGLGHSVLEVVDAAGAAVGAPIPYEITGRRAGDIERIWADVSRAEAVLGWKAERDLAQMLTDHWTWQRRNPEGFPHP